MMFLKSLFASLVLSLVSTSVLAQTSGTLSNPDPELVYMSVFERVNESNSAYDLNLSTEEIRNTIPNAKLICSALRQGISFRQMDEMFSVKLKEMRATGRITTDAEETFLTQYTITVQIAAINSLCTEFKINH